MDEGALDRLGPSIFNPLDSLCHSQAAHGGVQGEANVDHPILEGTYLLLHRIRLLHQLPIPMHLRSEPPIFLVDKSRVGP